MLNQTLPSLGFTKNQTAVYLALFELGKARAGEIIEATGLHRNLVYTSLEELTKRGHVTKTIKKGVAEFSANSPETLLTEVEERKRTAEQAVEALKKKQTTAPREVGVYEGIDSLKQLRAKAYALEPGETVHVLGGSKLSTMPALSSYWKKWNKKLSDKGVNIKFLFDRSADKAELDWRSQLEHVDAKYLPSNIQTPMLMAFFKDQLDLSILSDNPLTFSLKSKEVVDAFKTYFAHLWNQEYEVIRDAKVLQQKWFDAIDAGELRFIGGHGYFVDRHPDMFAEVEERARKKKGLVWKNVIGPGAKEHRLNKLPWMQSKCVFSEATNPNVTWLYGDTVIIANWFEEEPVAFLSTNKHLVASYNEYFDTLWKQKTMTFEGKQGFYAAFGDILDTLKKGEELLVMGIFDFDPEFARLVLDFHAKRDARGINARILLNAQGKTIMGEPLSKLNNTKVKYMEQGKFTPAIFLIYGQKTLVTIPGQRTFIQIDNDAATESFRAHFETLWK